MHYAIGTALPQDAVISVYSECACEKCTAKAPWFTCPFIQDRMVAKYSCTSAVECIDREEGLIYTLEGVPAQANVDAIAAKHPGCVLVYLEA